MVELRSQRIRFILAAALAAATLDARAEFCRCTDASFAWHGCSAEACDPGGWTSCSPSPDDRYTVKAGCRVEVGPGDDVLLEHYLGERVLVEAGGELVVRGPVEWRVGPGGLLSQPGSRVELSGCFRRTAGDPACAPELGPASWFAAGDVRPCRDGDCDGDAALVRLAYPPVVYGDVTPFLARLDAERDVLCFWQASEGGALGADSGYCYRIAAVGLDAEPFLDFDIRQVWRAQSDQAGYALARREVQQGTLQGVHARGVREVRLHETHVVAGRTDQMGRWVRCAGDQRAYLIASVRDDAAGDVLVLADDRGLVEAYADGERCHVDWGWSAGDLAFVMAPVHVTSTTNRSNEVHARLEGAASLHGVVFDGLGGSGGAGRGAVQIVGGPLERLAHVWITDPLVKNREALYLDDLPCGSSARHVTITGGPPEPSFDLNYGILWFGGRTCGYSLHHFYSRFRDDDVFVLDSVGADPIAAIELRWIHAGPSSLPGDSGQLLDLGVSNPTVLDAADLLCTACTSQDGAGPLVLPSSGGGTLARTLWVGAFNGGAVADFPGPQWVRFVDFGLVGSAVDADKPRGHGSLVGSDAERFYVRDYADPRAVSSRICTSGTVVTQRLHAGVVARVETGSPPCSLAAGAALSDVYFVDVARSGAGGALLEVTSAATDVELSRVTMAFSAPLAGITRGIDVAGVAHALLDGPLLTGFRGPGVAGALRSGSPQQAQQLGWGAPTCFFDNDVDDDEAAIAAYGTPPLRGVDPQFVDPAAGRFDLAASSPARAAGCGAGAAGIRDANWAHRKAKLQPLYMGPRPRVCGLAGPELLLLVFALRRRARRSAEDHVQLDRQQQVAAQVDAAAQEGLGRR
jgi:hypothetical protein